MVDGEIEALEVSKLSLSFASENPPLVVDLPEGQKIVVGNLDPGVVIEVATWRGTGRPDSRTSRLMLGIGKSDENNSSRIPSIQNKGHQESVIIESETGFEVADKNVSFESSQQVKTGVIFSNLNPVRPSREIELASSSKARDSKLRKTRTYLYKSLVALVFCMALSLLLEFFGLRIAHPMTGIKTSTGAANSSIFVLKRETKLEIGQNVIANLPNSSKNPSLRVISAIEGNKVLLADSSGYVQVDRNDVSGRVIMLFPYIGKIANIFD